MFWKTKLITNMLAVMAFLKIVDSKPLGEHLHGSDKWTPPDGRSRDEYMATMGLSQQEWNTIQTINKEINEIIKTQHISPSQNNELDLSEFISADDYQGNEPFQTLYQADEGENGDVYFGDVILNAEQASVILTSLKNRSKRDTMNFLTYPSYKWTGVIPYKIIGENYTDLERTMIYRAFQHWESHTCLRFQERPINDIVGAPHLLIENPANSATCNSFFGRQDTVDGQVINLGSTCFGSDGTPVHEIGHALGMYHEHQRPDRDDYINVYEDQIRPSGLRNFIKYEYTDAVTHVPYDYGSVMHYHAKAFWIEIMPSIIPKDGSYLSTIGQRTGLSFFDAMAVNIEYCSETCPGPLPQPCSNGGYQDPNNCDLCKCPDGLSGDTCGDIQPSNVVDAGGVVSLDETTPSYITSHPTYSDASSYYENYQEINWEVMVPTGCQIEFEFVEDFRMTCLNFQTCAHWVELKLDQSQYDKTGQRFCCDSLPSKKPVSMSSTALVLFRSNYLIDTTYWRRGFKLKMQAVNCPTTTSTTTTTATAAPTTVAATTTTTTTTKATTVALTTVETTTENVTKAPLAVPVVPGDGIMFCVMCAELPVPVEVIKTSRSEKCL